MADKVEEMKESEKEAENAPTGKDAENVDPDDASKLDENLFKEQQNQNNVIETSAEQDFQCVHPKNKGGHIVYQCKGVDQNGNWDGDRRYNEFYKLHSVLIARWPGIPIPTLPPKKAIGNKDLKFLNERRFYLDRFLKKMAAFDFVLNAVEFQHFSRPQGDVEKLLNSLPALTSVEICERLQKCLNIEEHMYDAIKKESFEREVKEFQHFQKQIMPLLKDMQKKVAVFMQNKSTNNMNYNYFLGILNKYEELNLANYVEGLESSLVFGNKEFKEQDALKMDLKNPYFNLYHWSKGELFDIEAVSNAISTRDKIIEKQGKTEKKKAGQQKDIDNVAAGRKSVKTVFKNEKDAGAMSNKLENAEKELEALGTLKDIITIYLGETVIPEFKARKSKIYGKIVQQFNVMQINDAHQTASYWSKIRQNPNVMKAGDVSTTEAKAEDK